MHIALAARVSHCQNKTSLLRAKLPRCDIHSGTHFRMSSVTLVHPNGRSGDCGDSPRPRRRLPACPPRRRPLARIGARPRLDGAPPPAGPIGPRGRCPSERDALSRSADSCRRDIRTRYRCFLNRFVYAVGLFLRSFSSPLSPI